MTTAHTRDSDCTPSLQIAILYPERRVISEKELLTWAADSYDNNADYLRCAACGMDARTENDCDHDGELQPVYEQPVEFPGDVESARAWLSDTGEVTFARR